MASSSQFSSWSQIKATEERWQESASNRWVLEEQPSAIMAEVFMATSHVVVVKRGSLSYAWGKPPGQQDPMSSGLKSTDPTEWHQGYPDDLEWPQII